MTSAMLTKLLAERGMGWRSGEGRFLVGPKGEWIKDHQFQPLDCVEDVFKLLRKAANAYSIKCHAEGAFSATVRIGRCNGTASGTSEPKTIALAVARALGIDVEDVE